MITIVSHPQFLFTDNNRNPIFILIVTIVENYFLQNSIFSHNKPFDANTGKEK